MVYVMFILQNWNIYNFKLSLLQHGHIYKSEQLTFSEHSLQVNLPGPLGES